MILAILSPSKNAYSETFIHAHKSLPFKNFFYCNGRIPSQLAQTRRLTRLSYKIYFKLKSFIDKKLTPEEQLLRYLLKKEKVDCVLAEYGVTAAESLKVIKSLNLPLVVHFHGFDASNSRFLARYRNKYLEVFAYAKSVIAVSKKMSTDIMALGCPEDKIILNTYGPNPHFFSVKPTFENKHFSAIGRFVDKKGPHLTIKAFAKVARNFPDARLSLAGDGQLLDFCKDLVKELGIEEQVSFLGIQSQLQIMKIFSASLAFVQHSVAAKNGDSEGTPVAVLEASAAGLPVIATKHGGIPDVIEHGKSGFLVEEFDVESMANYMIELCENPEKAKFMGSKGSENIRLNFTIEKHLNHLTNIIIKATGNNGNEVQT